MAYDEELAHRVRAALAPTHRFDERRMFGGLAFMVDGKMVLAVGADGLLARVDPADVDDLLDGDQVTRAVMGQRVMAGWLDVSTAAVEDDEVLADWLARGIARAAAGGTGRR